MNRLINGLAVRRPDAPLLDPVSVPAFTLFAVVLASVGAIFLASDFTLNRMQWSIAAGIIMFQFLLASCFRARGFVLLGTALQATALMGALNLTLLLATFMFGAGRLAFVDPLLSRADALLFPGFDWPATVSAMAKLDPLLPIADAAYGTLPWQPGMLVLLLSVAGRTDRVWAFVLAWLLTLTTVCGIFAFAPGVGGYDFHGIAASQVPGVTDATAWRYPELIRSLRSGELRHLDFGSLDGLVTFPSFHAGAAVLLGWGFWPLRWARWPLAALNVGMFLSAFPIGGHYLVDLIAGGAMAVGGIAVSRSLSARSRHPETAAPLPIGGVAAAA